MALHAPQPTQDIHRENRNSGSGSNTSEGLLRAGFAVCEAIAADDDGNQACNLRDGASEKVLDGTKVRYRRVSPVPSRQ